MRRGTCLRSALQFENVWSSVWCFIRSTNSTKQQKLQFVIYMMSSIQTQYFKQSSIKTQNITQSFPHSTQFHPDTESSRFPFSIIFVVMWHESWLMTHDVTWVMWGLTCLTWLMTWVMWGVRSTIPLSEFLATCNDEIDSFFQHSLSFASSLH